MLNEYHKKRNKMMIKAVREQRKTPLSLNEVKEQFERIRQGRKYNDKLNLPKNQ
jgi:hypothetical protein